MCKLKIHVILTNGRQEWDTMMVFKNFLSKAKDIDILASLPDGVLLVDNDGRIEWANDESAVLLKTAKNEIFKFALNELIESGLDLAKQAAHANKSVVGRCKNSGAKDTYLELSAKFTGDFLVVSLRDVTQNYKTVTNILTEHESSKKINKDKNAFLVKLQNELKSPLQSIVGFSQAMMDGLGGTMGEKQEKYIKIINKNSNELLYLMDKILELAKTESNLHEYDFQLFDVVNLIQTTLKLHEGAIKEKNLNLSIDVEDGLKKTIFSEENLVKLIMQNIFETAINSTDIGSISVRVLHPTLEFLTQLELETDENTTEKSFLLISVVDTGAGITEADLAVIFEPYAQLDRANKKNIVKSISLATVKHLVKSLNGTIWIESEPMQGTNYNVIIPTGNN